MTAISAPTWRAADVDVTTVERQLARLWREVAGDSEACAVRTTIFNLVVYAENEKEGHQVLRDLSRLPARQPSRTIVLVGDRLQRAASIDAEATVYCRPEGGATSRRCYEQLVIHAHGRAADHLSSLVIPLLMPELPTYLWWPGQPPFGHRFFNRLLNLADQLIVDSAQFTSPGDGLAFISLLASGRQGIHDFNWARLTPWREMLVQFFDSPRMVPYAHAIRSIGLEFSSSGHDHARATAGTLLLLGWISARLGWEPESTLDTVATRDVGLGVLQGERFIPVELRFQEDHKDSITRLLRLELVSQPKGLPPCRFSVERQADSSTACATAEVHGSAAISRVVPLDSRSDAEILVDELEMAGHDLIYEESVEMASRIAGREAWIPR